MWLVDCLRESRMRGNLMSGLGRGSRNGAQATAPAPYFTSGCEVHRLVRRGVHRGKHPDRADTAARAQSECIRGALGMHRPPRVSRPDTHPRRTAPPRDPERVRRPLQRPPSPSGTKPATAQHQSGTGGAARPSRRASTTTNSPRWTHQRILPGSVTEPNIRAVQAG
jgi:hypothetical protein